MVVRRHRHRHRRELVGHRRVQRLAVEVVGVRARVAGRERAHRLGQRYERQRRDGRDRTAARPSRRRTRASGCRTAACVAMTGVPWSPTDRLWPVPTMPGPVPREVEGRRSGAPGSTSSRARNRIRPQSERKKDTKQKSLMHHGAHAISGATARNNRCRAARRYLRPTSRLFLVVSHFWLASIFLPRDAVTRPLTGMQTSPSISRRRRVDWPLIMGTAAGHRARAARSQGGGAARPRTAGVVAVGLRRRAGAREPGRRSPDGGRGRAREDRLSAPRSFCSMARAR